MIDFSTIPVTEADVLAVRAVRAGVASADQQVRAMQWIGVSACRLFEPEFEPGDALQTAHNGGRRYVGILIGLMEDPRMLEHAKTPQPPKKPRGKP
jgi:hypothetical protein